MKFASATFALLLAAATSSSSSAFVTLSSSSPQQQQRTVATAASSSSALNMVAAEVVEAVEGDEVVKPRRTREVCTRILCVVVFLRVLRWNGGPFVVAVFMRLGSNSILFLFLCLLRFLLLFPFCFCLSFSSSTAASPSQQLLYWDLVFITTMHIAHFVRSMNHSGCLSNCPNISIPQLHE